MKTLAIALIVCGVSARVFEAEVPVPPTWIKGSRLVDEQISVRVVTKRIHQARIERDLLDHADPKSPNFRNWASHEETLNLLETVDRTPVRRWLNASGISFEENILGEFTFTAPAAQVERVFSTQLFRIRAADQMGTHATAVHLPDSVADFVSAVVGLRGLALPLRTPARPSRQGTEHNVTPSYLRAIYRVPSEARGASTSPHQAVVEFTGQYLQEDALKQFFQKYVPFAQSGDATNVKYVGTPGKCIFSNQPPFPPMSTCTEASLDIQYIMGVAPGVPTEFWYIDGSQTSSFCSLLKTWTSSVLSNADVPKVFSVSYGFQAPLEIQHCTQSEVNAVNSDFQAIGNKGITLLIASGDSGDGKNSRSGPNNGTLYPSWPASSPWVTAVGATQRNDENATHSANFGSGGGFSSLFPRPSYQDSAVLPYLANKTGLPTEKFDASGRATPDIAAEGVNFHIFLDGSHETQVGGTSASTPSFAALAGLINAQASKPLGFLNPWIYSHTSAFTDVTNGGNGFPCRAGWDPVTGVGVPIFPKLNQ